MKDKQSECYRVLELPDEASPEMIKQAYRQMAKVWHPDRFLNDPDLSQKANQKMQEINFAFSFLMSQPSHSDTKEAETTNDKQEQKTKASIFPLKIDKFLYEEDSCVELNINSDFDNLSYTPNPRSYVVTDRLVKRWTEFAKLRNVSAIIYDGSKITTDGELTRGQINFASREMLLDVSSCSIKTPPFLMSLVFVRDLTTSNHKSDMTTFREALSAAGCNGCFDFCNIDYLKAEQFLCKTITDIDIRKSLHLDGSNKWSETWRDIRSNWKNRQSKSLEDYARLLNNRLHGDAPYHETHRS